LKEEKRNLSKSSKLKRKKSQRLKQIGGLEFFGSWNSSALAENTENAGEK